MRRPQDVPAAAPFEPAAYPRTYRLRAGARWTLAIAAVAMAALAVFIGSQSDRARQDGDLARLVLTCGAGCLAIWLLARAWRTRLVLFADRLTLCGGLLSRHLAFADVAGRRRLVNSPQGLVLVPHPGRGWRLPISGDLARDAAFDAWFARVPDLDAAERNASLAQVLDDRRFGATPGDVADRLASVCKLAWTGNALALLAMLALQFGPIWWQSDGDVVLALCLPAVAFVGALLSRGLSTLTLPSTGSDARPSLAPMVLWPAVGLLLRLLAACNLRGWTSLLLPALAGGALCTAFAMVIDPALRRRLGAASGTLAVMVLFCGTTFVWLDMRLDLHAVATTRVAVTGKQARKGPTWRIQLGPAPTAADWQDVAVPHRVFTDLYPGQVACLSEHAGLFGLAWTTLQRCAGDARSTPAEAARHWLAFVARPASQRPPLAQRLVDGDWQGVDAELNGLQKRYEAGAATEVDVEQAFIPLFNVEPALDAPLAAWLAHAPRSYAAHLAMALHTERQVEWLSGYDERNSPDFNRQERIRFAQAHLHASLALSTRPAASLMSQYRLTEHPWQQASDWVERMVAIDPEDIAMRREYLIQHPLCPCRGAVPDDPAMRLLEAAQPAQAVKDALAAYRLFERGVDAGDTPQAIELYTRGLALHPYPQDAYEMHINIAVALVAQHRLDEAVAQLQAAIATLPGNRHAHEELGWVYELQNRMPEALAQFLVDAERGQSWAQMRAGSFLLTPAAGVPLDRRAGAYWMRRAADGGQVQARDILRRHPALMAEYPPTPDGPAAFADAAR